MVIWVVDYNQGKRSLEFGWHQVARKRKAARQGSSNNHGFDQYMDYALFDTSLDDSCNRT
jgi:hypothetical protein